MEGFGLMGLCAVFLLPFVLLKKTSPEQALLLVLAVAALVVLRCITMAAPLLRTLEDLFLRAGIEGMYISVLLRTVAASLVTHLCADLCRDGGSEAMASVVELTGAVTSLVIALPLLEAVGELILGYFG